MGLSFPTFFIQVEWLKSSERNSAPAGVWHCRNPFLRAEAGWSFIINFVKFFTEGTVHFLVNHCLLPSAQLSSRSVHHQPCLQFILYKLRCYNWTSPGLHSLVLKYPKCLIQASITPLRVYRHPACLFIRQLLISVAVLKISIISFAQLQ